MRKDETPPTTEGRGAVGNGQDRSPSAGGEPNIGPLPEAGKGPALVVRERQTVQLRTKPLRGENVTGAAQDDEMGLGLFDAADQPEMRFDLDDGKGERTIAEIDQDLNAEADGIKAMRGCLK